MKVFGFELSRQVQVSQVTQQSEPSEVSTLHFCSVKSPALHAETENRRGGGLKVI